MKNARAEGGQSAVDCVITSGQSLSAPIDLDSYRLCGISFPSNIDSATKATFQVSFDGTSWTNLYDADGNEKSIVAGVSRRVILNPADFYGVRFVKVRLGTIAAPTTTTANRTLKLIAEN